MFLFAGFYCMPFLLFFVLKFLIANLMIFNFWSIFGLILLGKSQKEQNEWQYYYRCHQKTKTCETENVLCVVELSTTTIEKITTRDSTQNIKGKTGWCRSKDWEQQLEINRLFAICFNSES